MATDIGSTGNYEAPVRAGDVLAGKYRVERVLAIGGMGVVVAARHLQLEQMVALKFVLASVPDSGAIERFVREARAAVRLRSEHVAKVTDVGTLETGAPFIVMEYLEGSDLSAVITQLGKLPVDAAADYVLQACEAVAEAHSLGIVHRDLKPQNLFLTRRLDGSPLVKVLDFGISKMTSGATPQQLTRTNFALGSPLYMAPEQMRSSKTVDARADIWALGVVLYELLAGVPPFTGESLPEICLKAASDPPPPIARPDLPPDLEAVVLRCLQKDPAARYQNVGELAAALVPFAPLGSRTLASRARILVAGVRDSAIPTGDTGPQPYGASAQLSQTPQSIPAPTPEAWVHRSKPVAPSSAVFFTRIAVSLLALALILSGIVWAVKRKNQVREAATESASTASAAVPAPASATAAPAGSAAAVSERPALPVPATANQADVGELEVAKTPAPVALAPAPAADPKASTARPVAKGGVETGARDAGAIRTSASATPRPRSTGDDDIPAVR